ncbi:CDP-alcohol phosphatidyltransferase [bacterium BMS3Abin04]|nr:CDP-alcohol phosphatidyltransferase [bacterium BMS3Abin04]
MQSRNLLINFELMSFINNYKKSLKLVEVEEILDLIFYRLLAFLLVKAFYNTNITPNQVTWIAVVFGILGGLLLMTNLPLAFFIAGVLYIINDILDCSDGQLARLKHNGTLTGRIVDGFSDYIVSIFAYIGIGIGFASHTNDPLFYWGLTILAGLSNAAHSIALDFYRNQFLDYALNRESILGDDLEKYESEYKKLKANRTNLIDRILILIYLKYSRIQISLSSNKLKVETKLFNPKEYYKKNKIMIRLWTFIGPTTELTFLIVCLMINRLDVFLYGMVTVLNIYALLLYLIQKRVNNSLNPVNAA